MCLTILRCHMGDNMRLSGDIACLLLRTMQGICKGRVDREVTGQDRDNLRQLERLCDDILKCSKEDEVASLALMDAAGRCAIMAGCFQAAANGLIRRAVVPSDGGLPGSRHDFVSFVLSCSLTDFWMHAVKRVAERAHGFLAPAATWADLSELEPTDVHIKNVLCFGGLFRGMVAMNARCTAMFVPKMDLMLLTGLAEVQARSGRHAAALESAELLLQAVGWTQRTSQEAPVEVLAMLLLKARLSRKMGQVDQACALFKDALSSAVAVQHGNENLVLVVCVERAACLLEAGRWADGLQQLREHDLCSCVHKCVHVATPQSACLVLLGAPWNAYPGAQMLLRCDISHLRLVAHAELLAYDELRAEMRGILRFIAPHRGSDLEMLVGGLTLGDDILARCASIITDAHLRAAMACCSDRRYEEGVMAASFAVLTPKLLEGSDMWRCALAVRAWCVLLTSHGDEWEAFAAACAALPLGEEDDGTKGDDGPARLVRYARVCRLLAGCRCKEALALWTQGRGGAEDGRGDGEGRGYEGDDEASRTRRILDGVRQTCGASATPEDLLVCCMLNCHDAAGALPLLEASGARWDHETRRSALHALNYARLARFEGDVRSAAFNYQGAWRLAGACVAGVLWVRTSCKVARDCSRDAALGYLTALRNGMMMASKLQQIQHG